MGEESPRKPEEGRCPSCGFKAGADSAECASCGVIFAKWKEREAARSAAAGKARAVPGAAGGTSGAAAAADGFSISVGENLFVIPYPVLSFAAIAAVLAFLFSLQFRSHLPISETMIGIQRKWLPLECFTIVLSLGERVIYELLGKGVFTFSGVIGTELAVLYGVMKHFYKRGAYGGMLFVMFWLGTFLFGESFYIADAKAQNIYSVLGEAGFSGPGGRDWGQKLSDLGLVDHCVGLAQTEFFVACWLLSFTLLCGCWLMWGGLREGKG